MKGNIVNRGWRHIVDNGISWTLFFKMGDFSWTFSKGDFSWTLLVTSRGQFQLREHCSVPGQVRLGQVRFGLGLDQVWVRFGLVLGQVWVRLGQVCVRFGLCLGQFWVRLGLGQARFGLGYCLGKSQILYYKKELSTGLYYKHFACTYVTLMMPANNQLKGTITGCCICWGELATVKSRAVDRSTILETFGQRLQYQISSS